MSSYPGGYAGLVAVALATHALVGYTLGALALDRPLAGTVGALAADADFLFPDALAWPFVHRGLTHSLPVAALAVAAALAVDRRLGAAFGVGYASHLLIDTTTPTGVPWLYPLTDTSYYLDLATTGHSPVPTLVFWAGCLGLLWHQHALPLDALTSRR
ncbi:MAG: metal-dependent hydrolase [Halobacterium sp.]